MGENVGEPIAPEPAVSAAPVKPPTYATGQRPHAQRDEKRMKLRYAGTCRACGLKLPPTTFAVYERTTRTVRCIGCPPAGGEHLSAIKQTADAPVVGPIQVAEIEAGPGVAGASARREYERRKARDDERLRKMWGEFGEIAIRLGQEDPDTRAWATGAAGEEFLGARLDKLVSESVALLHDRRIPGTKANIDHIAVTRAGVWVIDAKRYTGRPRRTIVRIVGQPRVEKLFVGRYNRTRLVDGVRKQIGVVQGVVGDVPVAGVLCFVMADWPLFARSFTINGVHVLWSRRLAKRLNKARGPIDVAAVRSVLARHFPPA